MKHKQTVLLLVSFLGFGLLSSENLYAKEQKQIVNVGFFEIKPHAYIDKESKQVSGASVDYLNEISTKLDYDIRWHGPYPFPRLIEMLKTSSLDCAIVFTKNEEREKFLNYPDQPYYYVNPILVVNKDSSLSSVNGIADIAGFKVGYLFGANLSPIIKNNQSKIKLELLNGKNWVEQNLLKLVNGRIDAVYDLNQNTMLYTATLMGIVDKIRIIKLPEKAMPLYVVFSKTSKTSMKFYSDYTNFINDNQIEYSTYINRIMSEL